MFQRTVLSPLTFEIYQQYAPSATSVFFNHSTRRHITDESNLLVTGY